MECCRHEQLEVKSSESMLNMLKNQENVTNELEEELRVMQHTQDQLFKILTEATHVEIRRPEDLRLAIGKLKSKFSREKSESEPHCEENVSETE